MRGDEAYKNVFSAEVKKKNFSYRTNGVLSVRAALTKAYNV